MDDIVTVRDLHNRFGAERVHEGLSLTVHRGEIFGIVGASGSGKSVLMRSILGLHQPDGGEIRVLGRDVRTLDAELSRRWGVVFQSGALISGLTVRENVELPLAVATAMLPRTRRELARLRLGMVGLDPDAGGKYPAELSGGMRRRAALARALALEPRILFLDEPTSGLDPVGASEFDELITGLRRRLDLTILMITHDLDSLFELCDCIAVLVDRIAIAGPLEDVVCSDHPWVRRFFDNSRARRASRGRSAEHG